MASRATGSACIVVRRDESHFLDRMGTHPNCVYGGAAQRIHFWIACMYQPVGVYGGAARRIPVSGAYTLALQLKSGLLKKQHLQSGGQSDRAPCVLCSSSPLRANLCSKEFLPWSLCYSSTKPQSIHTVPKPQRKSASESWRRRSCPTSHRQSSSCHQQFQ